ncbi:Protein of unknown function [Pyronema omphalodes CBS 100304]|uniref:Uncharacterized protein n=1 Tax=Pyronema omphalodes (strain CBS 100304) TaxID=1076935 RepID=U4LPZ2_PYROM|nr:Protein of unknown function [Pyronema omphalodes CBS 100304]
MQSNEQQRYNRKADPVPSEVPSSAGVQQISDTAIGIVTVSILSCGVAVASSLFTALT